MSLKTKTFQFVFVLVAFSWYAAASRGEEVRDASHFSYARLYCSPDGNSHFQDVMVDLRKTNFAPPASPIHIGSDFAASKHSSEASTPAGAPMTWRTVSTIPLRQLNSASFCKVPFPSLRPTGRRDDSVPAMSFGWRTPCRARDTL